MFSLSASTQYGDQEGTASVTWHGGQDLHSLAKTLNLPENEVPIGLCINRAFGINRRDPIEDEREQPRLLVKIFTVSKEELGEQTIPDYFQSRRTDEVSVRSYVKQFAGVESILNWFKEIEVVLLTPRLADVQLKVRIEDVYLD